MSDFVAVSRRQLVQGKWRREGVAPCQLTRTHACSQKLSFQRDQSNRARPRARSSKIYPFKILPLCGQGKITFCQFRAATLNSNTRCFAGISLSRMANVKNSGRVLPISFRPKFELFIKMPLTVFERVYIFLNGSYR